MTAGIIFSLLAAVVLNAGNITQKHAITGIAASGPLRSGPLIGALLRSREWLIGFALCVVGVILQVLAFALAPIPVVQSIFNAGIVLLIVASRVKLGERLRRVEWAGIAVVVAALTLISASLGGSQGSIGLVDSGWRLLVAVGPTLVFVVVLLITIRLRIGSAGFLFGVAAGLLYGAAALGTKGASTQVVRHGVLPSVPYVLGSPYPYVFVAFSAFGMLVYQTGLQHHRISVVGSMSDVVCSTYLVAVGMVVFGESLPEDPVTLALRFGGFAGVLVGTLLVATGGPTADETMPPIESDLGLGPVLVAEVDGISRRSTKSVSGP
jgi:drug/metabolite transporter (DMT)-like permease